VDKNYDFKMISGFYHTNCSYGSQIRFI